MASPADVINKACSAAAARIYYFTGTMIRGSAEPGKSSSRDDRNWLMLSGLSSGCSAMAHKIAFGAG
jgi:hypothetical protein